QGVTAQDVIDVSTNLGQHINLRDVARCACKALIDLRTVDDQCRLPAELSENCDQILGFGVREFRIIKNDKLTVLCFGRQSGFQRELTEFLGQIVRMIANTRTMRHTTTTELYGFTGTVTCTATTLLTYEFFRGRRDLAFFLNLMGTGAAFCQLPVHHAVQDVTTNVQTK